MHNPAGSGTTSSWAEATRLKKRGHILGFRISVVVNGNGIISHTVILA
jgi:hypothetical protein